VIQVVMDWEDWHLWSFEAGKRRIEPPGDEAPLFAEQGGRFSRR
jgi:hypothetical protein